MATEEKRRRLDALNIEVSRLSEQCNNQERKTESARSKVSETARELARVKSTLTSCQNPRTRENIEREIGRLESRLSTHERHVGDHMSNYQRIAQELSRKNDEYFSLRSSMS